MADSGQSDCGCAESGEPKPGTFNVKVLEELSESGCDFGEMAAWFGMTVGELREKLKDPKLRRIWKQGPARGRAKLRRAQFRMAEGNLSMALQLGRQFLRQSPEGAEGGGVTLIVDTGISRHDDDQG